MDSVVATYAAAKSDLAHLLSASPSLLHVHAGLLIFFAAVLLFRRPMSSAVPIGLVWTVAVSNELIDASKAISVGRWETVADVVNTVFWPTLLFLIARRRSAMTSRSGSNASKQKQESCPLGNDEVSPGAG